MKRCARVELESINMASVLMLLSRGHDDGRIEQNDQADDHHQRVFECKTCNRHFPSFQALGGHRASHKKPRPSDHDPNQDHRTQSAATKPKVHECSICGLEFAVGQALGGHMRRHRSGNHDQGFDRGTVKKINKSGNNNGKRVVLLDLNLPPCDDEMEMVDQCGKLGLGLAPMVDCLH